MALLIPPGQPGTIVMLGFLIFAFFNAMAATLTIVYPGELFPTEIRGGGVGFATAASRIGAAAGTFLLPVSMERLGMPGTMMIGTGICAVGAIVAYLYAPETKGVMLSAASGGAQ
jgi:putative MFS transporter